MYDLYDCIRIIRYIRVPVIARVTRIYRIYRRVQVALLYCTTVPVPGNRGTGLFGPIKTPLFGRLDLIRNPNSLDLADSLTAFSQSLKMQ